MRHLHFCSTVVLYCLLAVSVNAGEPTDLIKSTHQRFVQALRDPTLQSEDKERELNDRLRDIRLPVTDVDEMAKRVLATHWNRITPAQRKEFVDAFRGFLEGVNRIPSKDASLDLVLESETIQGEFAEVKGYFNFSFRRDAPAIYKLHLVDGKWKVFDGSAWGIERVDNLRAQFNRVIANSSFEGLIKQLREKKELVDKRRSAGK
jgi:phospholipid transport system substrate-binding protein